MNVVHCIEISIKLSNGETSLPGDEREAPEPLGCNNAESCGIPCVSSRRFVADLRGGGGGGSARFAFAVTAISEVARRRLSDAPSPPSPLPLALDPEAEYEPLGDES